MWLKRKYMQKEELIQNIWNDKKGKENGRAPYALYVALDSPRPNLEILTDSMFKVLSENTYEAPRWAETFGRAVICVGPGNNLECVLGEVKDDRSKRFVPVQTTEILNLEDMERLTSPIKTGSMAEIVLNSQPMTIEAFLISYVHMVDELIWELFRKSFRYGPSLKRVIDSGFTVSLGSEEEILTAKVEDPTVSVRLYGSGVNKNVPKVIGGIKFKEQI